MSHVVSTFLPSVEALPVVNRQTPGAIMSQLNPVHIFIRICAWLFFFNYSLASSLPIKFVNAFHISTGCGTTAGKTIFATAIVLIIYVGNS